MRELCRSIRAGIGVLFTSGDKSGVLAERGIWREAEEAEFLQKTSRRRHLGAAGFERHSDVGALPDAGEASARRRNLFSKRLTSAPACAWAGARLIVTDARAVPTPPGPARSRGPALQRPTPPPHCVCPGAPRNALYVLAAPLDPLRRVFLERASAGLRGCSRRRRRVARERSRRCSSISCSGARARGSARSGSPCPSGTRRSSRFAGHTAEPQPSSRRPSCIRRRCRRRWRTWGGYLPRNLLHSNSV